MSRGIVKPLFTSNDVVTDNIVVNCVNKQTDFEDIGVSSTVSAFPVKPEDQTEVMSSQGVCFSDLQYCDVTIQGHAGVFTALKDSRAEVSLIKSDLVEGLDLPCLGTVMIRGILGEPMQAKLVAVNVKPAPENGFEYIGPPLNVIFAVGPLRTDKDIILCGSAVEQLEELQKYSVVKPNISRSDCSFSPEHENLMDRDRVKVIEHS